MDEARLWAELEQPSARTPETHRLFAYPAQSNYSGVQHPLEWIAAAQERSWDVLVDGSAFVRTGCLCNPGAREAAFQLPPDVLDGHAAEPRRGTREHCSAVLGLASVVRVSLGVATNFADVYRFVRFARTFLDNEPAEHDLPPRRHC